MSTKHQLAQRIARAIFALGDEPKRKCSRIAFMGDRWPQTETEQGGLCELALAVFIEKQLNNKNGTK